MSLLCSSQWTHLDCATWMTCHVKPVLHICHTQEHNISLCDRKHQHDLAHILRVSLTRYIIIICGNPTYFSSMHQKPCHHHSMFHFDCDSTSIPFTIFFFPPPPIQYIYIYPDIKYTLESTCQHVAANLYVFRAHRECWPFGPVRGLRYGLLVFRSNTKRHPGSNCAHKSRTIGFSILAINLQCQINVLPQFYAFITSI